MNRVRSSRRSFLRTSAAAAAGLAVSACAKPAEQVSPTEENKALVRRYCEELWNQGNWALIDEIVSPDFVNHGGNTRGRSGHMQWCIAVQAIWPDLETSIEEMIAEGDKVAYRWTANPTTEAPLYGVPTTGKKVKVSYISIVRIADGMIAELWQEGNTFDVYQQLGGVSATGTE